MEKKLRRTNKLQSTDPTMDEETLRLAESQLEHIGLVGIHMGPDQLRALAAAARVRLAESE